MADNTIDTPTGLSELIDHVGSWDWENQHVGASYIEAGKTELKNIAINDIIESGTVLIVAGPADLDIASDPVKNPKGFRIVPIGLVETAQISINKPLSRIFEIGSFLSYIIPGRVVGGISLSRVFFDGPSLLKVLYMGEVLEDYADGSNKSAKFVSNQTGDTATDIFKQYAHIGSGNLAANLASRFFNQPVGLGFIFKDQESDQVSELYFEGCRVGTWNMGISANMNVLTEAINIEFVRIRPIVTAASNAYTKGTNLADIDIVGLANS